MMSHLLKISTLSLIVDISALGMTDFTNDRKIDTKVKGTSNTKDNMSHDIATDVTNVNTD